MIISLISWVESYLMTLHFYRDYLASNIMNVLSRHRLIVDGVWIGNRIYRTLISRKDYAATVLHTSQITIGHTRSFKFVTVFISRCLAAAPNGERSLSSGFPNCPRPRLPAAHSNSSQELNPSGYLIPLLTYLLTYGAEPFLRSHQLCSHSRTIP
jgi:hypothetical protein